MKNTITNIIAFLLVILEPIESYLIQASEFDWQTFLLTVGAAVIAYFTGKGKDGKKEVNG